MALHTQLPIYRTGLELMALANASKEQRAHYRRWGRAGINGEPIRPCEYAAAIRASGAQGDT